SIHYTAQLEDCSDNLKYQWSIVFESGIHHKETGRNEGAAKAPLDAILQILDILVILCGKAGRKLLMRIYGPEQWKPSFPPAMSIRIHQNSPLAEVKVVERPRKESYFQSEYDRIKEGVSCHREQDTPPSGHWQQRSARLLKGPDESATTIQWRQRFLKKEERRSEGEGRIKRVFGLVDKLPLRSQRAPLLSADVDNGAAAEAEDGGSVCVSGSQYDRDVIVVLIRAGGKSGFKDQHLAGWDGVRCGLHVYQVTHFKDTLPYTASDESKGAKDRAALSLSLLPGD
ncbi:hypothetical protein KUCAC02_026019, partial [Chaenocephalus aceratus]